MQTIWNIREETEGLSLLDQADQSLTPLSRRLLALRSIRTLEEINQFLFPKLEALRDPFQMKGIREASRRILIAAEKKELIMIHGDYDVDGITGAALLSRTLEKLGASYYVFLPHRTRDGYGVSLDAIKEAAQKKVTLMIAVDCGISAVEEVDFAKRHGIDTIVIDHHQIHPVPSKPGGFSEEEKSGAPDAFAVINPLQNGCQYPFKELSACGLAFKLAQALIGNGANAFLDLVALSSVCDIAPLIDENRVLAKFGMDLISQRKNPGLDELCSVAKLKSRQINSGHLGFILGPRINACGRMSSAETALRLLLTDQREEAKSLAKILDQENKSRQQEEKNVLKQAFELVEHQVNFNRDQVIVVWCEGWHEGVIGIVAQRLVERYGRPSLVIALDGEKGKGSGRSVRGFHLFEAFGACADDLEEFGGHELAAGFSISKQKLESFRSHINAHASTVSRETFVKKVRVDLEISFDELTPAFLRELQMFEPFGAGNPRPVFLTRHVASKTLPVQPYTNTLRWWVLGGRSTYEAVWTQSQISAVKIPAPAPEGGFFDIVYSPKLKEWQGIETVILEIKDIKAGEPVPSNDQLF